MTVIRCALLFTIAIAAAGCVTPPLVAESFSPSLIVTPAKDEVVLVIFRQVTPPTIGSLTVDVRGSPKTELPNNSFAVVTTKAGPTNITVTYPAISVIKPITVETSFEGGTTHYLEIVGGLGSISAPGPYVQVWGGLAEKDANSAIPLLLKCCRRVHALPN